MAGSLEGNKLAGGRADGRHHRRGQLGVRGIIYHPHHLEEPVLPIEAAAPAAAARRRRPRPKRSRSARCWHRPMPTMVRSSPRNAQPATISTRAAPNKVGPDLWGVVNRPIAEPRGLQLLGGAAGQEAADWDYDHLNHFLTSPKAYVPGTKMSFAGISKDSERADVIAYLRTLADDPPPLPGG